MHSQPLFLLITFFGVINLLRMTLFLIGSDLFSLFHHIERKKKNNPLFQPEIAVIIPAHNEKSTVLWAIRSVLKSTYPQDKIKIIVVDDGSDDETPNLVEQYVAYYSIKNVVLIRQNNSGKARALNRGIQASGDSSLVMCLDADSYLDPTAIARAVEHFHDPLVATLSANVRIVPRNTFLNIVQQYEYLLCYQMKRAESLFSFGYIVGGIGSTFRRSVLDKVGYYDTNTVTEDIDLTMKILQLGNKKFKVSYGWDVIVHTESVLSIDGLLKQRFRWKWGRTQTFLKNANLFFSRDSKYTKSLTWFYLPFALYGDLSYFIEPLLLTYILGVSLYYHNILSLLSACVVMSTYLTLNVLAESTISLKRRVLLAFISPLMYVSFYVLSFVEYVALLRTIIGLPNLAQSLLTDTCGWVHVKRPEIVR